MFILAEKCYDIFDDCNDLMTEDKKFCSEDIEASRGCRKSCKLCSFEKPLPGTVYEKYCIDDKIL